MSKKSTQYILLKCKIETKETAEKHWLAKYVRLLAFVYWKCSGSHILIIIPAFMILQIRKKLHMLIWLEKQAEQQTKYKYSFLTIRSSIQSGSAFISFFIIKGLLIFDLIALPTP